MWKKLKAPFFLLVFYYWSWGHKAFARRYGPYPHLNTTRAFCSDWFFLFFNNACHSEITSTGDDCTLFLLLPMAWCKVSNSGSRILSRGAAFFFCFFFWDFADVAKQSRMSKVSQYWLGSRPYLRPLEALAFLILKYAFSHFSSYFFFKLFNVHLCQ